ncbi:histone deacetylase [Candidatus Binatia bacterium]|jgi:acetoin utilization deacetylase AcuC-like enzyme|nr:histone deacetylase [Candidatus Binatia bacterium]
MRTAIVVDPRYRAHDTGEGHPERPERLLSVERTLHDWRGAPLEQVPARLADEDEIRLAHSADLYAKIARTQHATRSHIDADTATCDRSFETALLAAGGLLELGDAVATGAYRNGFAFVRPPGHHATSGQAMGFCLFNNVAIAARHLQRKHGYRRIAIIDWDLHHGNGTEAIFYDDPSVLYVSLHQYPFYPGTGAVTDTGRGDGLGFNVNVPFSAGVGDEGYALALEEIIAPVLRQFAPEFLLVSAGFDCHWRDPLGGMQVTEKGFVAMSRILLQVAEDVADGRLVAVLEGGYDLDAIRGSTEAVLDELTHGARGHAPGSHHTQAFDRLREVLAPHWRL